MGRMLNCPDCGTLIELPTARFCHKCGQFLLQPHIAVQYEGLWEQVRIPQPEPWPRRWVASYSVCFNEQDEDFNAVFNDDEELHNLSYAALCDELEDRLRSVVSSALSKAWQIESDRDSECLGVRFEFIVEDKKNFPEIPKVSPFKLMEVLPYREVYPDVDDDAS